MRIRLRKSKCTWCNNIHTVRWICTDGFRTRRWCNLGCSGYQMPARTQGIAGGFHSTTDIVPFGWKLCLSRDSGDDCLRRGSCIGLNIRCVLLPPFDPSPGCNLGWVCRSFFHSTTLIFVWIQQHHVWSLKSNLDSQCEHTAIQTISYLLDDAPFLKEVSGCRLVCYAAIALKIQFGAR